MEDKVALQSRAILTGASGHIGYQVGVALLERGVGVDLLVRRTNSNVEDLVDRGARVHTVQLSQPDSYANVLNGADVLFHVAAPNTTDTSKRTEVLAGTAGLTEKVLSGAVSSGIKTIVYTSSVVVLGRSRDPKVLIDENGRLDEAESPYVEGKYDAERFCDTLIAQRGIDLRRVYPSWVVGPGDLRGTPPHQVIGNFLRKGQRFYFDGGISIASVREVARAHVAAWLEGKPGAKYLLGGENVTFRQFFEMLAEISGKPKPSIFLPKPAILAAAVILKAALSPLGKKPPVDPAYVRSVIGSYSWYDSKKAVEELGYKIPPVRETLTEAVRLERMRMLQTYELGRRPHSALGAVAVGSSEEPPLLLTGVPGWLGNRFIDVLMRGGPGGMAPSNRRVHLLVEPRMANLLELPENFRVFPADLRDSKGAEHALEGVGTVIHLAGAIYPPKIATLYAVNYEGTKNLVDQCIAKGVRRFLYMSTDSVCGHGSPSERIFDERTPDRPFRHYGRSKWMAERYILEKTAAGQLDGTILRGFWFFGPFAPARQMEFLRMMKWPRQLVFGNGKNLRSISLVDNTVYALRLAEPARASIGKVYWVGDEKPDYTVDQIYGSLCEGLGVPYRPLRIPAIVCSGMRWVDSAMGRMGLLHPTVHGIAKFDFDIAGTTDAAQRDFGYRPVTSLKQYAAGLRNLNTEP